MTAALKNPQINNRNPNQPSSSKPPRAIYSFSSVQSRNTDSNPNNPATISSPFPFSLSQQDRYLSRSTHLTRHELIKRRSHNVRHLSKLYRNHYWALMEELKAQHREYYWNYGVSPFKDDAIQDGSQRRNVTSVDFINGGEIGGHGQNGIPQVEEGLGENVNHSGGNGGGVKLQRCMSTGCKSKAMALTQFCHLHILSDANQILYKPCGYIIKSAQSGNITCGKAILRSSSPPFCATHFQKAQKHVYRALKKAGISAAPGNKLAPQLHAVIAEYVRQIQSKRRAVKVNTIRPAEKEAGDC